MKTGKDALVELDLKCRREGVSDHDRHELLRYASVLALPKDLRSAVLDAIPGADTTNVDLRSRPQS